MKTPNVLNHFIASDECPDVCFRWLVKATLLLLLIYPLFVAIFIAAVYVKTPHYRLTGLTLWYSFPIRNSSFGSIILWSVAMQASVVCWPQGDIQHNDGGNPGTGTRVLQPPHCTLAAKSLFAGYARYGLTHFVNHTNNRLERYHHTIKSMLACSKFKLR